MFGFKHFVFELTLYLKIENGNISLTLRSGIWDRKCEVEVLSVYKIGYRRGVCYEEKRSEFRTLLTLTLTYTLKSSTTLGTSFIHRIVRNQS